MRQSESARMASAEEARFRINYPNSTPRMIKVIALDREAGNVVRELGQHAWNRALFFDKLTFPAKGDADADKPDLKGDLKGWLNDIAGQACDLVAEIDSADIVVVVASPGSDAQAAMMIGEACMMRHKSMIGLILKTGGVSDQELSVTLRGMRPYATMLVIANGTEYIVEMLTAMRA